MTCRIRYVTTCRRMHSHLPRRVQHAWQQHARDPDVEATVHRIAWSAVKRRYRKDGDLWVPIEP
jgi:cation transport regulator